MTAGAPGAARLYAMAARAFGRAQFDEARTLADACLELDANHIDAWVLAADAHRHAGRAGAARACLARALERAPKDRGALSRALHLASEACMHDEAAALARRLLDLDPGSGDARRDFGVALARAGRRAEALTILTDALARYPGDAVAAFEAGTLRLCDGDFSGGWGLFEARRALDDAFVAPEGVPPWRRGETVAGKRLLVVPEGGHGDAIWSARFLPAACALGAEVHLVERPSLAALFSELEGVASIVDGQTAAASFDLWAPMLSLPFLLGVADPAAHPPARLAARDMDGGRLPALLDRARGRLRVGLIWSGNPDYGGNRRRAMSLADMEPLLDIPFAQFYSLQKGPPRIELEERGLGDLVIDTDDFDFAETAALVRALDLVVMTDSAVAHLAGSLGRRVLLLLDADPYWYWGRERDRTPWYPSIRLFRQQRAGDWAGTVERARGAILEL